jgi:hypothetical protein
MQNQEFMAIFEDGRLRRHLEIQGSAVKQPVIPNFERM